MQTSNRNLWIIGLVVLLVSTFGVSIARPVPQAAAQANTQAQSAEERLKALEKLKQELLKNVGAQPQAQAPPAQPPSAVPAIVQRAPLSPSEMKFEFEGQDLYAFITLVADFLGITPIVIDPDVKGTVTIHSSQPMGKEDILPLFNIILKNNNAALVKGKGIYQIVPISQGLREGLDVITHLPPEPPAKPAQEKEAAKKSDPAAGGAAKLPVTPPAGGAPPPGAGVTQTPPAGAAAQTPPVAGAPAQAQQQPVPAAKPARPDAQEVPRLATHIIRVEFVPVQNLIEPLKLFMTDGGVIMPYERLNMLIITEYTDNVQKLLDVVRLLDSSFLDADLMELAEIKYNKASDVLEDLQKLFGSGKDSTTGVYMVALDRINTILVMANSRRALEEVRRWIARLDTTAGRSIQTFIYTVENGTASNIAAVLSLLFGAGDTGAAGAAQQQTTVGGAAGGAGGISGRGNVPITGGGTTATPFTGAQGGTRSYSGGFGQSSMYGGGMQGYGGYSPYGGGAGFMMGGGQGMLGGPRLSQGTGMFAQVLSAGQFTGLQGDVRIVVDDLNNSLIIQGSAADYAYLLETIKRMDVLPRQAIIDARIFEIDLNDALSFGVSATLQGRTSGEHLTTASISQTTGALSLATFAFIGSSREILMGLDALRQKTRVRILEAPSVLALDGTPARINVGGSVPIPTGTYVPATGGASTGVSYADTGTSLLITPRISASGTVTLYIVQELRAQSTPSDLGPTFTQTAVETTLAVKDGESVAIAGLIRELDSNGRNGVPFLQDIPVLGYLFGRTTRTNVRTELLIMITPHVIRTPERFQEMTQEIKDSLRDVRKFVDEKQKESLQEQEKARKDRLEQEQKQIKKIEQKPEPVDPVKKEAPPAADSAQANRLYDARLRIRNA